jgi:hypothetical protein
MSDALRIRSNQAQQVYTRALSSAWRNGVQLHDPSLWQFRDPEVEEKMLRDADIRHAVGYRRHLIAGKDWQLMPKDPADPRGKMATAVGESLLRNIESFTQARMNLARAFFSGARFARIHGEPRILDLGDGKRRTWWVPTRLEDTDKRMYRIVPSKHDEGDGDVRLSAVWERWNVGASRFEPETRWDALHTIKHVYQDDEATLGYGSALREALGWWWYAKEHVFQESLAAVERFAQGIITAKVDGARDAETGAPNTAVVQAWEDVLTDLRSRHVLVMDKADDVEIISGSAEGWQLLEGIRAELRSTIYTLVMGANLTTSATEGGSYALAEVQENSTEALLQFDRETLQETLTRSLVACVWHRNYANLVDLGVADSPPEFTVTQEKRQDPKERAEVASVLLQNGVSLSLAEVLEQTGFALPEEGEEVIAGRAAETLGSPLGFDLGDLDLGAPAPQPLGAAPALEPAPAPPAPEPENVQETALNGAQVAAATELIQGVVAKTIPPRTAVEMLVSMFNLPRDVADRMVADAAAFTPAAPLAPEAPPAP